MWMIPHSGIQTSLSVKSIYGKKEVPCLLFGLFFVPVFDYHSFHLIFNCGKKRRSNQSVGRFLTIQAHERPTFYFAQAIDVKVDKEDIGHLIFEEYHPSS